MGWWTDTGSTGLAHMLCVYCIALLILYVGDVLDVQHERNACVGSACFTLLLPKGLFSNMQLLLDNGTTHPLQVSHIDPLF